MMAEEALKADASAIRRDLEYMVSRWGELDRECVFEIRALKEGAQPQSAKFSPGWIAEAVEWIVNMNALRFNIYAVRNPIRYDVSGSASDADIVAAFFLWADCDDGQAGTNVLRWDGPKYSAAVMTGRTPEDRVHVYWELKEPCTDLDAWSDTQSAIARHFGSDNKVINPSRIMRVGGTVTYPATNKRERGYINELATFRNEYPEPRHPVTFDQMQRAFAASMAHPRAQAATGLRIDTGGHSSLDRETARVRAMSGEEWHNHVIRLVGSYVAKGLTDGEIHGLTDALTLNGYTVEDTRREVQTAIDGARRKGWTPEPKYADPAQAMTAPQAAPQQGIAVEWFRDITPALTDNYIVKNLIGADTMSVIYGPSNSGKTFWTLDLAFHIAAGIPWRGRRVNRTGVLYLAAEGGKGVANRIAALKAVRGVGDIPLALRRAGLDLLKQEADLQIVYALAQEVKAASGGRVMVVIDTLSRVMAGGDENSAADMTALIRNIDAIREATNCHIMLVHHSGKDVARGARGHSSLRAATDTEIEVQNEDGNRAAIVTKQRDYQGGETFAFELKGVVLGEDQDGDEVSSCVVEVRDGEDFEAAKKAAKGRGKNQQIIMDTFDQMVAEGMAQPNPGGVGMPEAGQFWAVDADTLRELSMGKMVAERPSALFRQAWGALTAPGAVFVTAHKLTWRVDRRIK
jgi:hypothetical protein